LVPPKGIFLNMIAVTRVTNINAVLPVSFFFFWKVKLFRNVLREMISV